MTTAHSVRCTALAYTRRPPSRSSEIVPVSLSPLPPLPYTVRSSRRTRRLTLRVEPGLGLVVSVPSRFARRDIPGVVEQHRAWAESALAALARATPPACRVWPPETLELAALGRVVEVVVEARPDDPSTPSASPSEVRWLDPLTLLIRASADDRPGIASAIAAALRPEGRALLVPRLAELASRHGLTYERVAVRGQRSVWGSCSSRGTVSLNWKLLFLRPALVDYVLLHELAHTRHLNHSPAFWALLEQLEPDTRALDAELSGAGRLVPPWLELARGGSTKSSGTGSTRPSTARRSPPRLLAAATR